MFLAPNFRLSVSNEYGTFQLLSTMRYRDANGRFLIVARLEQVIVLNRSFLDCDQSPKRGIHVGLSVRLLDDGSATRNQMIVNENGRIRFPIQTRGRGAHTA